MDKEKHSIKETRPKQKYLIGIAGFLFMTIMLFSCDIQDVGTNKKSNTSTPNLSNFSSTQQPYTLTHNLSDSVPVVTMPPVNVQTLLSQDQSERQQGKPVPPRFGKALDVNLTPESAGRWDKLSNGGRLWRLSINSKGAYSINFIFDRYKLPPDGELFIYNKNRSTILGPFTEDENKPFERFSTLPVSGSLITLEYFEPIEQKGNTKLSVGTVIHGYRNLFSYLEDSESATKNTGNFTINDFGDSGSCNINVNCHRALGWQDETRSVAMVLLDQNTRICSGALVNNVAEDRTPYFLSAFHCADTSNPPDGHLSAAEIDDAEDWLFWFNYKSETCSDPFLEPGHNAVSGATFRAGNDASDFLLLELTSVPPSHSGYAPHFAGWTAVENPTRSFVAGIHHPSGDIMKFSSDDETPSSVTIGGVQSWYVDAWDHGTTEGGSSGSPLFNQNHHIIGQDFAGDGAPACGGSKGTYYGRFSESWDGGSNASERLRDWLDPNNTGTLTIDGTGDNLLQVHIDGPYQIQQNQYYQFEALTDGGYRPYSWQWQIDYGNGSGPWQNVGGDSEIYTHISYNSQDFNLRVQVTDDDNVTKTSTIHPVTVTP